jgi:hypothetical protein
MEIKPNSRKDISIKNRDQVLQIQTVNFKEEDVMHLFFPEQYEIRKCSKGHIIIVRKHEE